MTDLTPEQIAVSLSPDERRMVLAKRADTGGSGAATWISNFPMRRPDIWEMRTFRRHPHLTPLGLAVRAILQQEPKP